MVGQDIALSEKIDLLTLCYVLQEERMRKKKGRGKRPYHSRPKSYRRRLPRTSLLPKRFSVQRPPTDAYIDRINGNIYISRELHISESTVYCTIRRAQTGRTTIPISRPTPAIDPRQFSQYRPGATRVHAQSWVKDRCHLRDRRRRIRSAVRGSGKR